MPDPIAPTGSSSPGQLASQVPNVAQVQRVGIAQTSESGKSSSSDAQAARSLQANPSAQGQEPEASDLSAIEKELKGRPKDRNLSLEDAAKTLKEYLKNLPSDLQFRKDEETGTVVFKVVNPVTKEVIREFPPKEIVEMSKRLRRLSAQAEKAGILLDTET